MKHDKINQDHLEHQIIADYECALNQAGQKEGLKDADEEFRLFQLEQRG